MSVIKHTKLFLIFLLLFLASTKATFSQTPTSTQTTVGSIVKDKQEAIKEGSNQEAWLDEALSSNIVSSIRLMTGDIPEEAFTGETDPDMLYYIPGGAIGGTTHLISNLFRPPISGIEYIAEVKNNLLGKPVYAQGIGFAGLDPLRGIWRAFRNTTYLLASIIFILIGLMIIFRIKINPQTVVSIQNAVPQIITTLILITFSYAIAGLLIDFISFIQAFFVAILFQANGLNLTTDNIIEPNIFGKIREVFSQLFNVPNSMHLFDYGSIANTGFVQYWDMVKAVIPTATIVGLGTLLGAIFGTLLGALAGSAPGAGIGAVVGIGVGGALLILILQIIILISLIRFFFGLIKAYIIVLIKVITAPFEIAAGAFPNSKINFSSWLTDIVAHLAIFPASVIFIVLVNIIVQKSGGGPMWAPSLFSWVGTFNLIPAIIGIGAILLLPRLPDMIPQIIFQIKPSPWGSAIGESFKEFSTPSKLAGTGYLQTQANIEAESYRRASSHRAGETFKHSIWDTLGVFGAIKRPRTY